MLRLHTGPSCEFDCNDMIGTCIDYDFVCNGIPDCPNESDETAETCGK